MSYLADHQIAFFGESIVTPFRRENVQPASLDLCLSNEVGLPVKPRGEEPVVDMDGAAMKWDIMATLLQGSSARAGLSGLA